MNLFVIGAPGKNGREQLADKSQVAPLSHAGGAGSELWHVLRLWRNHGHSVTCLPTWNLQGPWRERLNGIGVNVLDVAPDSLLETPGLAGSVVVSFCNVNCLERLAALRAIGCRVVWAPCMCWPFPVQRKLHPEPTPLADRIVFQSRYQRDQLLPFYRRNAQQIGDDWNDSRWEVIRGAFYADEFPYRFRKHVPGMPFVVGRMSRAARDKFPLGNRHGEHKLWQQYQRIRHGVHVRVMGWNDELERELGPAPNGWDAMPECEETPQAFLSSLHCYYAGVKINAKENWPRVGLEAMSSGVPIVAENSGGWPEMIVNGKTGFLASTPAEATDWITWLANCERKREEIAENARNSITRINDNDTIGRQWDMLFQGL